MPCDFVGSCGFSVGWGSVCPVLPLRSALMLLQNQTMRCRIQLPSATSTRDQTDVENRTVVLTLLLSRSGAVREARVLKGPVTLRAAAIKAVREQNKKHRILPDSPGTNGMMVEIKFPQDQGAPEIRQVRSAGASSCVTAPTAVRALPPTLTRLLNVQPMIPVLVSEPKE